MCTSPYKNSRLGRKTLNKYSRGVGKVTCQKKCEMFGSRSDLMNVIYISEFCDISFCNELYVYVNIVAFAIQIYI